MADRIFALLLVSAVAVALPQVAPPPFLPPASAGAGVAVGNTPLGGGVGVGIVSAFPSQPFIPDISSDVELVKVRIPFPVKKIYITEDDFHNENFKLVLFSEQSCLYILFFNGLYRLPPSIGNMEYIS